MTHFSTIAAIAPPIFGGITLGCASALLLASIGRIAGISGIAAGVFDANAPVYPSYLKQLLRGFYKPSAWRLAFIVGLVVGGWGAAQFIGAPTVLVRPAWVLITAGLLVGLGTVMGSGCTSGHGVCGLGRRSLRSLVATGVFMATGIITVFLINVFTGRAML